MFTKLCFAPSRYDGLSLKVELRTYGRHFGKWRPFWPWEESGMSLYPKISQRVCPNCVPIFMLVSSKAQNYLNVAHICWASSEVPKLHAFVGYKLYRILEALMAPINLLY